MAENGGLAGPGGINGADAPGCADSEHVLSRDCPAECLAWVLSRMALNPLLGHLSHLGTVGNVMDMYQQERLGEIWQLGPRRIGEIGIALRYAGLAGPTTMSTDQHPSLITEDVDPPSLTLILPGHLDADQTLASLARAISQTRADLVGWVRQFQQRVLAYAASGDQLRQAQCRGQVLAGEHAISHLDENIIEVFDIWDQYENQVPGPAAASSATGEPARSSGSPGPPPT